MEVFDLLERVEQRQARIIQQLIDHPGQQDLTTIAATMQLDRSTLRADLMVIQQLFQQLADPLELQLERNQVHLVSTGQISAARIYYHVLQSAVKYQLLLYLLQHGTTSKIRLADHLAISVSTLNRRIHELNDLLAEYQIQIKNGRLVGVESQIRYFYFHLFWFARPFELNKQEMSDVVIDTVLAKITTSFGHPFTEAGIMKIRIWLFISEKRRKVNELTKVAFFAEPIDITATSVRLMQVFSDPYFEQHLFNHNRNERILLYMFVQGGLVLDTHNQEAQTLIAGATQQADIRQLNQRFLQITQQYFDFTQLAPTFKHYLINTLTQIHYNFSHFQGLFYTTAYADSTMLNAQLATVYHQLLQVTAEQAPRFTRYLAWRYLPLLYLMMHASQVHLRVGCDFAVETSLATAKMDQIRAVLPLNIKVDLRRYNTDSAYDLVLTDMSKTYLKIPAKRVFIECLNNYV